MFSFISFVFITVLVGVFSLLKTRNSNLTSSTEGYFLGGRSLTGVFIAGSMLLMNISTEQLVGLNGLSWREGFVAMAYEVGSVFAIVVLALIFLPKYLKLGITTIPEYLEKRFDEQTLIITSILFLGLYILTTLPIVLYTGSLALESIFHVSKVLNLDQSSAMIIMIWGIGILGTFYAVFGGVKLIAIADTLNGFLLFTGGLLVTFFGLLYIGSGNIIDGLVKIYETHPEKFNSLGDENSSIPYTTLFTGVLVATFFYWCANQAIVQKSLSAKNLAEGQKDILLCAFIKLLIPLIIIMPGIIAYTILNGHIDNPDSAYPILIEKVMPSFLIGYLAAALVGAVFSTFSGALSSSVTLFMMNIYKKIINKNASDLKTVRLSKILGVFLAIIAMLASPLVAKAPHGLFLLIMELQGIFSGPILSVVLVAVLSKRISSVAAKTVLLTGPIIFILLNYVIFNPTVNQNLPLITGWKMNFIHLTGLTFAVDMAILLTVGYLFPRKIAFEAQHTHQVDITPWVYAKPVGALIALGALSIYILLGRGLADYILWIYYAVVVVVLIYVVTAILKVNAENNSGSGA